MNLSKAPFNIGIYHNTYMGLFEAYKCSFCHRTYFTEMAYKEIMSTPVSLKDFTPFKA